MQYCIYQCLPLQPITACTVHISAILFLRSPGPGLGVGGTTPHSVRFDSLPKHPKPFPLKIVETGLLAPSYSEGLISTVVW